MNSIPNRLLENLKPYSTIENVKADIIKALNNPTGYEAELYYIVKEKYCMGVCQI